MLDNWILVGALERFADATRATCDGEMDASAKAYATGKADGLDMAGSLLREFSTKAHVDLGEYAGADRL
jgi:hypothetical protein